MRTSTYDFSEFYAILDQIVRDRTMVPSQAHMLQNELNRFFDDSQCTQVLYSENEDKLFFGIKILPQLDPNMIYDYLMTAETVRIDRYMVEIDSQLLDPMLGLSYREILAMLLHEIGNVINDQTPMTKAREALDCYLIDNKETLKISDSVHYKEILAYGLKDYISKNGSMFYEPNVDEIICDDFIRGYGFSTDLESASKKVMNNNIKLYENVAVSRFVVFAWTLRLYKNLKYRRVAALHTLNKMKELTGSRIEKMEMENVIRRINRIDDDALLESGLSGMVKAKMAKARRDAMRSIEDDYYELNMRIRNVEDEDDALYLMRQINTRMAIVQDYMDDKNVDNRERMKWDGVLTKFRDMRDRLSKTVVYKSKTYGLYVSYPDIKQDNY